jgi:hypothetical protein
MLIPKGRRTAFRAEAEQSPERSDACSSIVQEALRAVPLARTDHGFERIGN